MTERPPSTGSGRSLPLDADAPEQIEWTGNFVVAKRRGRWEYAGRARGIRAAVILALVQVTTAARIYGKLRFLPERGAAIATAHRWSGRIAFLCTLPVFFHCVTILGFQTPDARVALHSIVGTFLYGVFVAKVLIVRTPSAPGWALPVAGSVMFTTLVVVWLTSALWFIDKNGFPAV